MPSHIEQLSRLPTSSVVIRNVYSIALRSRDGMAQWVINLRFQPYELRVFAFEW